MSSVDELFPLYGVNHVSDTLLNNSRFPGSHIIFVIFVKYFIIFIKFPSGNKNGRDVDFLARNKFIKYRSDSSSKHAFCM